MARTHVFFEGHPEKLTKQTPDMRIDGKRLEGINVKKRSNLNNKMYRPLNLTTR